MNQGNEEYVIFDNDLPTNKKHDTQNPSKQKSKRKSSKKQSSKDECETPKKKIKTEPKTPTTSPSTSKTSRSELKKSPIKKEADSSNESSQQPPKKKSRKAPTKKSPTKLEEENVPKPKRKRSSKKANLNGEDEVNISKTDIASSKEGDSDGSLNDESYEIVPSNDTETQADFLTEKKHDKLIDFRYMYGDLCSTVLDEISLEGLDGITLEGMLYFFLSVNLWCLTEFYSFMASFVCKPGRTSSTSKKHADICLEFDTFFVVVELLRIAGCSAKISYIRQVRLHRS